MPQKSDLLRMDAAARYYYRQTGATLPTEDTVRNWATRGKVGYSGIRVWLKIRRVKRGLFLTRKRWVDEFIDKMRGPNEICQVAD